MAYRVWVYGRGNSGQILPLRELGTFDSIDLANATVEKESKRLVKSGFLFDAAYRKWHDADVSEYRKDGTCETRSIGVQTK